MISILDWAAENYHWTHEEITWHTPMKTIFLYMRESEYKSNLHKPPNKRKAMWTLSDKEMVDAMEKH